MGKDDLIKLDCLGDICPIPIMKLMKYEKKLAEGGKIMLVTDHSCTSESVQNYCSAQELELKIVEPINGVWEMYISRSKSENFE